MASSTVTMDDRCSSPIRPSAIRILLWSFAIRESAHPPQPLLSPQKACEVIAKPQRHFSGCRGEMLSTTWQGACVTRCLAVVPNITSPNVRPWW